MQREIEINKEGNDLSALEDNLIEEEEEEEHENNQQEDEEQEEEAPQEKPQLSPEEILQKKHLILKLRAYVTKFPKHFKGINYREFMYYDIERLEATLDEFKYIVGTSTSTSIVHMGATIGFGLIETIGKKTPLKLDGFSAVASQDESIQDIINELSIEYGSLERVSPEKRLVFSLCRAIMATHGLNVAKEKQNELEVAQKLAKEATAELIEKSRDL